MAYLLLHLLLGGFRRLVVTPTAVEAGVVFPAWILIVAALAFLRDEDPVEAGVLMAAIAAGVMFFTILLRSLVGGFSQPEQSALLFSFFALPVGIGVASGVNAGLIVAVVRFARQREVRAHRSRDRVMRTALWGTVALNVIGVFIFTPLALGRESALVPMPIPPFAAAQIALTIGLFGGVYAWLALQPVINRPLVIVGALGKLGFFGLTLAYSLAGWIPARAAWSALPDLVFGGVFLWWAWGHDRK